MKFKSALCIAGAALVLVGCTGSAMTGAPAANVEQPDKPGGGTPSTSATDRYAPCTDQNDCCSGTNQMCSNLDPDTPGTCTCVGLWDCGASPKKCESSASLTPAGGGQWSCMWSRQAYFCVGGKADSTPNGIGGWSCTAAGASWTCKREVAPNPTNSSDGLGAWSCVVGQSNKLICERVDDSTLGGEPTDTEHGTGSGTAKESNCADGIDNDGDGLVDCKDNPDCAPCPTPCPPGQECCDGKDNDGDGRIDEGNVCSGVGETTACPPGAYQSCDCYCGVHRKCRADGTWGPCIVDITCAPAEVTTHSQCGEGQVCDYGGCSPFPDMFSMCHHHADCPTGQICDMGMCVPDPYRPELCPAL